MKNVKEIPYVFKTTFGKPLDIRFKINSISTLMNELPLKLRYEGLIVYVKDIQKFYSFIGGINDSNFKPLLQESSTLKMYNVASTKDDKIYIDSNEQEYFHGLNSTSINVELYDVRMKKVEYENIEIVSANTIKIKSNLKGIFYIKIHI